MEVVDHDRRVRQQSGGADRRGVDRGWVDGHELDRLPELRGALGEPVDDGGAGGAFALPEQALVAGQVDESGVPWVDPHPPPGRLAAFPAGLAAAGLVDAEYRGGVR